MSDFVNIRWDIAVECANVPWLFYVPAVEGPGRCGILKS